MCSISCLCELSYFQADHRFLQASVVEFKGVQGEKKLLMIMMVNILIIVMRKIKEKVFVKKTNKQILFFNKHLFFIIFYCEKVNRTTCIAQLCCIS